MWKMKVDTTGVALERDINNVVATVRNAVVEKQRGNQAVIEPCLEPSRSKNEERLLSEVVTR